jgi:hypothetical protein
MTTTKDSLNDAIKALYVGKTFKGLEEDSHLENDANYQTVLNHNISNVEITRSFKNCYYEGDDPETVLTLNFYISNKKNNKHVLFTLDIELDTKFIVEDLNDMSN